MACVNITPHIRHRVEQSAQKLVASLPEGSRMHVYVNKYYRVTLNPAARYVGIYKLPFDLSYLVDEALLVIKAEILKPAQRKVPIKFWVNAPILKAA